MKNTRFVSALIQACIVLAQFGNAQTPAMEGLRSSQAEAQTVSGPVALFTFERNIHNSANSHTSVSSVMSGPGLFVRGLEGQALSIKAPGRSASLTIDGEDLPFDKGSDFAVQFWIRTTASSDSRFVVLSRKEFEDNSLKSQKRPGWAFYLSNGTWAWTIGSGDRRLTYERDNGKNMPLNDGRWHQLAMTYDSSRSLVRLFYDGDNKVLYNLSDSEGFDFTTAEPVVVGWNRAEVSPQPKILPAIEQGATSLQRMVEAFNRLGAGHVESEEFLPLIVDPQRLFDRKVRELTELRGADRAAFVGSMESADLQEVKRIESELMSNPYTIHQSASFVEVAPLSKLYALVDGKIAIREREARTFAGRERLDLPDFDMDNLKMWDRVISPEEVQASYSRYFMPVVADVPDRRASITAAAWNIEHGGKHFTIEEHGWDSRVAIAEMLRKHNVDVVMMQETYSSGDFIAAELGYYFATTVDWDYLNQGANISVLSRFPITELYVQQNSPFMNVGVKLTLSKSQELYAMSNWYGMQQFEEVFEFHSPRFQESSTIPTLFAGDFNAVPHTDGGDSPASRKLMEDGFTDAFRSTYSEVETHPGYSHRSGRRIDQLYYKGAGLRNTSTEVISTWPPGFPSDHYLIVARFDLNGSVKLNRSGRKAPR